MKHATTAGRRTSAVRRRPAGSSAKAGGTTSASKPCRIFTDTPVGRIELHEDGGAITGVYFNKSDKTPSATTKETSLLKDAARQLQEYFSGARTSFDLPLAPHGTTFQRRVWAALRKIPYGETRSYGQLAAMIGSPKASRAVGGANNRNPICLIIPCHRVIGANGTLVGYGGGLPRKKQLLSHEASVALDRTKGTGLRRS